MLDHQVRTPDREAAQEAAVRALAALAPRRDGLLDRRDTEAALRLLKRLLHNQPVGPETITTDGLASYGAALDQLGLRQLHRPGRLRENNRVENFHLPIRRRERQQQQFKSQASAQRFLTTHAAIYNTFNIQRHLINRPSLPWSSRCRMGGGDGPGEQGRAKCARLRLT